MDTMGWDEGHFLTDWAVLAESLDSVKESLRLPRGPACALTQRRGGRGSRWPSHWTAPCRLRRPLHPQMRTRLEEDTALPFLLQRPQHTRRRAARRASANAEAVRSKVLGLGDPSQEKHRKHLSDTLVRQGPGAGERKEPGGEDVPGGCGRAGRGAWTLWASPQACLGHKLWLLHLQMGRRGREI